MIAGDRGAVTALACAEGPGSRGGPAFYYDEEGEESRATTHAVSLLHERWRLTVGAGPLFELVSVLLRARSPEARRLARAIARSGAPQRLAAGDEAGFRAEVGAAACGLWPEGQVPFPVSWALQAAGILAAARIRGAAG